MEKRFDMNAAIGASSGIHHALYVGKHVSAEEVALAYLNGEYRFTLDRAIAGEYSAAPEEIICLLLARVDQLQDELNGHEMSECKAPKCARCPAPSVVILAHNRR